MRLTVDDMLRVFGEEELLQIAGTGARDMRSLDVSRVEDAIAEAHRLAQGYIRERWPTAVDGTPLLNALVADIARYRLRSRGGQSSAMNDVVRERHDAAIMRLRDLQAGRLSLDVPTIDAGAAGQPQRVIAVSPPDRVSGLLAGFR